MHSPYYDADTVARSVAAGTHRESVGGMWETIGSLQLDFLRAQGMQPRDRLLDVGCGALRLGCLAVDFLDPGHYYGVDISPDLISAGYRKELTAAQRARLPETNLSASPDFDLSFLDLDVDIAIAQSVFTHLPLNHIRRCLANVSTRLRRGAVLYATAWLVPSEQPLENPFRQAGEIDGVAIVTRDIADPYHYRVEDFLHAARELPLAVELIGDWGHPRGQPMMAFKRK